jgi:hypothetical protein
MPNESKTLPPAHRVSRDLLSGAYGVPTRSLGDILALAGVRSEGGYDERQVANAIINDLRTKLEASGSESAAAKRRKSEHEATIAEVEMLKATKAVVMRDDAVAGWADLIAQGSSQISALPDLTDGQKDRVLSVLRSLKLPELE